LIFIIKTDNIKNIGIINWNVIVLNNALWAKTLSKFDSIKPKFLQYNLK